MSTLLQIFPPSFPHIFLVRTNDFLWNSHWVKRLWLKSKRVKSFKNVLNTGQIAKLLWLSSSPYLTPNTFYPRQNNGFCAVSCKWAKATGSQNCTTSLPKMTHMWLWISVVLPNPNLKWPVSADHMSLDDPCVRQTKETQNILQSIIN